MHENDLSQSKNPKTPNKSSPQIITKLKNFNVEIVIIEITNYIGCREYFNQTKCKKLTYAYTQNRQ